MFVGHFAVGLAAKRVAPAVSLGMLFLACQLADLIWPNLVLLGVEHLEIDPGNTAVTPLNFVSYPYSHSLVALVAWGLLAGGVHRVVRRSSVAAATTVAAVVASHWLLDAITHGPDMPLTPVGAARAGLGLWNSVGATVAVEAAMLAVGLWLYCSATRPSDRVGVIGFWSLIGFLVAVSLGNLIAPPPPSPSAVAWTAQSMWLVVAWAFWVDRHRAAPEAEAPAAS